MLQCNKTSLGAQMRNISSNLLFKLDFVYKLLGFVHQYHFYEVGI